MMLTKKLLVIGLMTAAFGMTTSVARAADDMLAKIKAKGVMTVCMANYFPYAVKNPATNEWEGLDLDIGAEIAKLLNVKIEIADTPWPVIMQSITTGKCDVSFAPSFVLPARAEQVLFTQPFSYDSSAVFVASDSPINTLDDLDRPGNTIAFVAGTAEDRWSRDTFKKAELKALLGDTSNASLLEVSAKRVTAAVTTRAGNIAFIKNNPQLSYKLLTKDPILPTPFAFMVPKGEYHFQQYLNVALSRLEQNGVLPALNKKWLGALEINEIKK
ncbi:amino acid ABC transporter substrate-binding protein [Mesorhizobium sp. CGMCC 1.15528]|uniref:Amino acid ABC transporter substrate-binding protein n=1 Tax=Mesorhizobium zhangyense TaxID=1776730 RepID=A0A7C9VC42_9HYPH|nr:ABC transporter substrate-binding protein [Mesorhizobium zhangyense]NGN45143.1 amino acid ABC transporter substrate-binding protein [Mesorhizobium zhangyense]